MTLEIPLTQGKVALIDDEDLPLLSGYKWHAQREDKPNCTKWYASATIRLPSGRQSQLPMHRLISGAPAGRLVDHKDGDGLNNRRNNFRICTRQENNRNIRKLSGASQYKGISYHKGRKKWYARITVDGKDVHVGSYESETEAARAYDNAAKKHFGEFARLNFE